MIRFSISERFYNTYWSLEYSEKENEWTDKAKSILYKRLMESDFSELTEEESDIICYACQVLEDDEEE